jgi:uncharacterized phage protein (TIGR01671 family)
MRRLGDWTFEFIGVKGELQMMNDDDGTIAPTPSGTVLMQFTGLKDKNGKEIYEGDIVSFAMRLVGEKGKHIKTPFIGSVEWRQDDGGYLIYFAGKMNSFTDFASYAVNSEVIGNIHENPSLLK